MESGYFTSEQLPKEYCDCHVTVDYCTEGKGIACDSCPESAIKKVALIQVEDRSYPAWVKVTDAQYVYRQLEIGTKFRAGASYAFFESLRKSGEYFGTSSVTSAYNRVCTKHYIVNTTYEGKYNYNAHNTTIPTGSLVDLPTDSEQKIQTTVDDKKRYSQ